MSDKNGKRPSWVVLYVRGFKYLCLWCKVYPAKGDIVGTWPVAIAAFEDKKDPDRINTGGKPWAPLAFGWQAGDVEVIIPRSATSIVMPANDRLSGICDAVRADVKKTIAASKIQIAGAPQLHDLDRRSGPRGLVKP